MDLDLYRSTIGIVKVTNIDSMISLLIASIEGLSTIYHQAQTYMSCPYTKKWSIFRHPNLLQHLKKILGI